MTINTGWTPRTPFESECMDRGLVPSQVAVALSFGRDMIAEFDASLEDDCNDNGCGNCHCSHCNGSLPGAVNDEPIYF